MCGFAVQPDQAWLWIDVQAALGYLRETQRAGQRRLPCALPSQPRWELGHGECSLDEGALHDVRLPVTYRELLSYAPTMLEHELLANAAHASAAANAGQTPDACSDANAGYGRDAARSGHAPRDRNTADSLHTAGHGHGVSCLSAIDGRAGSSAVAEGGQSAAAALRRTQGRYASKGRRRLPHVTNVAEKTTSWLVRPDI